MHGGALASLLDTAAMAASWSGAPEPERLRGSTVALSVGYAAPAEAADVGAEATVLRRGRTVTHVQVVVRAGGTSVAQALVQDEVG